MSNRITIRNLENLLNHLNDLTNSPKTYRNPTTNIINVGHFTLSGAYGGYTLHRVGNTSGGVSAPLNTGYISKRELFNAIWIYIRGFELGQKEG